MFTSRRSFSAPPRPRAASASSSWPLVPTSHSTPPTMAVLETAFVAGETASTRISSIGHGTLERRKASARDFAGELEGPQVHHGSAQPALVITTASPRASRPTLTSTTSVSGSTLESALLSGQLRPRLATRAEPESFLLHPPPPSPPIAVTFNDQGDTLNPSDPRDLPLPSPPREGEYIFPDSLGRASLLPTSTPPPPTCFDVRTQAHNLPFSPADILSPVPPLPRSPTRSDHANVSHSQLRLPPRAPKLEPTLNCPASPSSGRLSTFTGSPRPFSPKFELGSPMFDSRSPLPSSPPASPRSTSSEAGDDELVQARARIRELEKEVIALREELSNNNSHGRNTANR